MSRPYRFRRKQLVIAVATCCLVVATSFTASAQDSRPAPQASASQDWLRGSGDNLQILLKGKLVLDNGAPANDCDLVVELVQFNSNRELDSTVKGNEFECWIPVNANLWHSIVIRAEHHPTGKQTYRTLSDFELRTAAINGIQLELVDPTRELSVSVTDAGVPVADAHVQLRSLGPRIVRKTDETGVAKFDLLPNQTPVALMAWTDDYRIGGFSYHGTPARNPQDDSQTVELSACRDQLIRVVDEENRPVPNIRLVINVATPEPDFNYLGINDNSYLVTTENGEATYKWFPDWAKHDFYIEPDEPGWIRNSDETMNEGVITASVKRSMRDKRKLVSGHVSSSTGEVAGLCVLLESFQGEQEHTVDRLKSFTDSEGNFSMAVLPGATYMICIDDLSLVSEIFDLIPFDSENQSTNPINLEAKPGQRVDISAVTGPNKRPLANQLVGLESRHDYSWRENEETRSGRGARRWWVQTDSEGRAIAYAQPGKLNASIYTPTWSTNAEIDVVTDKPNSLELHRKSGDVRTVTGRVKLTAGLDATIAGAKMTIGSLDGESREQLEATTMGDGTFSFQTSAAKIGICAQSADGKATGVAIIEDLDRAIDLQLEPTQDYFGQVLGEDEKPLVDQTIKATVQIFDRTVHSNNWDRPQFTAWTIETTTDGDGKYVLRNVPTQTVVSIRIADRYPDEVFLEPGEARPIAVSRIEKQPASPAERLWSDRFETGRRDCKLNGFHLTVVITASDEAAEFANSNLKDYQKKPAVSSYIQLMIQMADGEQRPPDLEFARRLNLALPKEREVCAYTFDANGNELGRLIVSLDDEQAEAKADQFVASYLPATVDASKKWDEAFEEAKRSNRRVWARVSQRYCGPCFLLARWLDDHEELLSKDYIMFKVDDVRDLHGIEVMDRITRDRQFGIPFHAIFDPAGKLIVDSESPVGDIGHPSGYEGKKHLKKMLMSTRQRLTEAEIVQLISTLED